MAVAVRLEAALSPPCSPALTRDASPTAGEVASLRARHSAVRAGWIEPIRQDAPMSVQEREDRQGRVGPFVTFVEHVRPDGVVAHWDSRRHRKHLQAAAAAGSTWWAPRTRGWWIAVLFAVGSLLFAVGAVPGYASAVGTRSDAGTFFIGSLFFTAAGFLTYREAVDAAPQPAHAAPAAFLRLPAAPDRLVGDGDPAGRDLVLQRQHRERATGRPHRLSRASACVAARRLWFGVLPGGQRAGLVRGLPRLGQLAAPVVVMVDHAAQPDRLRSFRYLRRGRLHQPGDRPVAQRRAGESGHLDRRPVLPGRGAAAAARAHRGKRNSRHTY